MFKWLKRNKQEPNDGRHEKRESMQKKSDAIDELMRSLTHDRRTNYERRQEVLPDFEPERRHA